MNSLRLLPVLAMAALVGCAQHQNPDTRVGALAIRAARAGHGSTEERAGQYLRAAAESVRPAGQGNAAALKIYNDATGELTELLRGSEGGRLWNQPLTLSADGATYRLRLQQGGKPGIWSPDYFTSFIPANKVALHTIKKRTRMEGIGGTLVGVRKKSPREEFSTKAGVSAPVTATLDFKGNEATLVLRDPSAQKEAKVAGAVRPLAADFSAPLGYYPHVNELINGIMGAITVSHYMDATGLYLLQPYDPARIPVIFVHGLISTPQMWRNVINEIETDPLLRARYQYWVFGYPTGNPVAYSALRFRQELAKARRRYGFPHGFVLVGHSMGGIVSHMQGTTVTRADWDRIINTPSQKAFMLTLENKGLLHDAVLFDANPDLRRTVYVCTPHRGSEMALSGISQWAAGLISLPGHLMDTIQKSAGATFIFLTNKGRPPTSVASLSPNNPTLKVLDNLPCIAPHHTILGNRGKKGPLEKSSDGVVPYWSSHLKTALSEKVIPGSHASCEHPETIAEIQRILRLHLSGKGLAPGPLQ